VVEIISLPPGSARSSNKSTPLSVLKSYSNGELAKLRDSEMILLVSYSDSANCLTILESTLDAKKAKDGLMMSVFDF